MIGIAETAARRMRPANGLPPPLPECDVQAAGVFGSDANSAGIRSVARTNIVGFSSRGPHPPTPHCSIDSPASRLHPISPDNIQEEEVLADDVSVVRTLTSCPTDRFVAVAASPPALFARPDAPREVDEHGSAELLEEVRPADRGVDRAGSRGQTFLTAKAVAIVAATQRGRRT